MKLSIVVPIYNSEKSLKKCIESLINQTYKNIEIILVNDGSLDKSLEICNDYKKNDDRIKIINQKNQGAAIARKNGIENSTGDLISFVDSDDCICLDMYEKIIKELILTKSDISICGYYFDYGGKLVPSFDKKKHHFKKDLLINYLKYDYIECMLWNKVFKRELFINIKYENHKKGEDLLLCIQLINNAHAMCYYNEPLYYYYVNPNSIMRSKFKIDSLDELIIYDKQYNFFKQNINKFDEYEEYLVYKKLNCVIRIIRNMCDDLSYIKHRKVLKNLYYEMIGLYDKIHNKTIILPILHGYYKKIKNFKYFYLTYIYLYNKLRKIKIVFRKDLKK